MDIKEKVLIITDNPAQADLFIKSLFEGEKPRFQELIDNQYFEGESMSVTWDFLNIFKYGELKYYKETNNPSEDLNQSQLTVVKTLLGKADIVIVNACADLMFDMMNMYLKECLRFEGKIIWDNFDVESSEIGIKELINTRLQNYIR